MNDDIAQDIVLRTFMSLSRDGALHGQQIQSLEKRVADMLAELRESDKDQRSISDRLGRVEENMSHLATTVGELRADVRTLLQTTATIAGQLERNQVIVNTTAVGKAGDINHEDGMVRDIKIGKVGGDVAGGNMNKFPTKWLIVAIISLIAVAGAIAGVKLYVDSDSVHVDPANP